MQGSSPSGGPRSMLQPPDMKSNPGGEQNPALSLGAKPLQPAVWCSSSKDQLEPDQPTHHSLSPDTLPASFPSKSRPPFQLRTLHCDSTPCVCACVCCGFETAFLSSCSYSLESQSAAAHLSVNLWASTRTKRAFRYRHSHVKCVLGPDRLVSHLHPPLTALSGIHSTQDKDGWAQGKPDPLTTIRRPTSSTYPAISRLGNFDSLAPNRIVARHCPKLAAAVHPRDLKGGRV